MAAALLTLLLGMCQDEFDVEVSLPEKVSGHYSFLYYASDPAKGWFAEEMMMVEKGREPSQAAPAIRRWYGSWTPPAVRPRCFMLSGVTAYASPAIRKIQPPGA